MSHELTDADYAALADFRFSLRQFQAFSEAKAAECGLTPQQHQALLVIRAAPAEAATVGHVAERLILKPHSATGLVDRLVSLGLVQRAPSPDDKRRALLALTEQAHRTLETLSATHREEIGRLKPMLIALLDKLQV
ncbi:DNA-binding MarR family transcriptional regulator [Novosphingobium sp. PhB165]|uniref:MarR family winged helix-turn-helix transcriptional regulator n=1 Tax=Novosphingobium sp. PhB165 TaxID=2485105 RepID=UPI001050D74D|nr:MarR family transcriptional regulator [Novosphingobium sp. PhB165]TCM16022.1 DNA-binding MarR family transcriptional regulator [Novosphingobium sp. PhB165]